MIEIEVHDVDVAEEEIAEHLDEPAFVVPSAPGTESPSTSLFAKFPIARRRRS